MIRNFSLPEILANTPPNKCLTVAGKILAAKLRACPSYLGLMDMDCNPDHLGVRSKTLTIGPVALVREMYRIPVKQGAVTE